MPSLVIPATVQCTIRWDRTNGRSAYNVLHYAVSGFAPVTQADADAYWADVLANFNGGAPVYKSSIANEWQLAKVSVRDIRAPNLPAFESGVATPGTSATDPLPNNVALCVTLRTAFAGRSFRGRIYLPGFSEGASDGNGQPSAAIATQAELFVTGLNNWVGPSVGGAALAVASRKLNSRQQVTAITVRDLVWDTQRRRARTLV